MSQNTQRYSRVDTALQSSLAACNVDPLGLADTLKVVACPICRATYIPSDEQIGRGSTGLLETAFIGVCRFCFRCQRPACPQCWNPVHSTCASCSEEARLPFRTPVPSVEGLVFLPSTSARTRQANNISFTCQRNGRFYTPETAPTRPDRPEASSVQFVPTASDSVDPDVLSTLPTRPDPREVDIVQSAPSSSEPLTSGDLSTFPTNHAIPAQELREIDHYPAWLQEVLGQKVDEPYLSPANGGAQQTHSPSSYSHAQQTSMLARANEPGWSQMAPTTQQIVPTELSVSPAPTSQLLPPASPISTARRQGESEYEYEEDTSADESSLFERVENVLIIITSILLLAVVLMIVLSIVSPQVNAFILHFLHIDIRTEIAYLLQLR